MVSSKDEQTAGWSGYVATCAKSGHRAGSELVLLSAVYNDVACATETQKEREAEGAVV